MAIKSLLLLSHGHQELTRHESTRVFLNVDTIPIDFAPYFNLLVHMHKNDIVCLTHAYLFREYYEHDENHCTLKEFTREYTHLQPFVVIHTVMLLCRETYLEGNKYGEDVCNKQESFVEDKNTDDPSDAHNE